MVWLVGGCMRIPAHVPSACLYFGGGCLRAFHFMHVAAARACFHQARQKKLRRGPSAPGWVAPEAEESTVSFRLPQTGSPSGESAADCWRCIDHMARIAGVDLPRDKRVEIGLTYIYGIGLTTSQKMLAEVGINPDIRVKDLSENDISKLRDYIEHHLKVEGDLRREVSMNIKRLIEIGSYRGVRHRRNLPVRGQRSKTNARTRKGPKRTVGNKKK